MPSLPGIERVGDELCVGFIPAQVPDMLAVAAAPAQFEVRPAADTVRVPVFSTNEAVPRKRILVFVTYAEALPELDNPRGLLAACRCYHSQTPIFSKAAMRDVVCLLTHKKSLSARENSALGPAPSDVDDCSS
jgi:hypothetical protein